MTNPFQYGGVVGEDAFCDRQTELADLLRAMQNGERLFLFSERRMGKTSLVRLALTRLPRDEHLAAYVDLWPTDSEKSFVTATARALAEATTTRPERMLDAARAFFPQLSPVLTLDGAGKPELRFEVTPHRPLEQALEDVLSAPARIAEKRRKRVVVVFDEFQQILQYGDDRVERTLRSVIQGQDRVAYLFLGSQKHLIQEMVLDRSSPLYRAGAHYPLRPIPTPEWQPFIRSRFEDSKRRIPEAQIEAVCEMCGGHPFYTQHLCHALWELCEPGKAVTDELVRAALALLLERESQAYSALWEPLTGPQRRLLVGLAHDGETGEIYATPFRERHDLGAPSTVQRAATALLRRDLIDRSDGTYVISDRFFRLWIRRDFAGR
jgi:hypothetical protein